MGVIVKSNTNESDSAIVPAHYRKGSIECINPIEAMTESMPGAIAPHAANVLKYLWRFQYKNGMEDLKKAEWYLKRLIQRYSELQ